MKYLEIKISNSRAIEASVADNWNELTKKQILYIGMVWQSWAILAKNEIDMQLAKAQLFINLLNTKSKKETKGVLQLFSKSDFELLDFNPLAFVNFIFEGNNLTTNHFKKIRSGLFGTLYGPDDKLSNVTINEFSFAINFYNQYNKTGDEKFLNLFVACLYRPTHKDWKETGDLRKPFIPGTINLYLKQVEKVDIKYKQAIFLYFTGCMDFLAKCFPMVFSRAKDESGPNTTFLDVILGISGGKFGNFDQTKDQNAFLVFKELNTLLVEQSKNTKK